MTSNNHNHSHMIPAFLSEDDLEAERIGEKLRSVVNLEALAADLDPASWGTLEARIDRSAWHLAEAAIEIYDMGLDEMPAMQRRITSAMQLPREAFETSLNMICPESGRGWDLNLLQARHPGVIVEQIIERITQLRSAFAVIWIWRPGDEGNWKNSRVFASPWLDEGQMLHDSQAEALSMRRCRDSGEVATLDSHLHGSPLPDDLDGNKRLAFIADAGQLMRYDASCRRTTRKAA